MTKFRFWLLTILIIPNIYFVLPAMRSTAEVRIETNNSILRCVVDTTEVSTTVDTSSITSLRIQATPSIYPQWIEHLLLKQEDGQRKELDVVTFTWADDAGTATGDWFIDRRFTRQGTVWEYTSDQPGPITFSATLVGRNTQPVRLSVIGNETVSCDVTRGMLRNEVILRGDSGKQLARSKLQNKPLSLLLAMLSPWVAGLTAIVLACVALRAVSYILPRRWRSAVNPMNLAKSPKNLRLPMFGGLQHHATLIGLVLPVAALSLYAFVASSVLDRMPHFQDEVCYLLQARWLLDGKLSHELPDFYRHITIPYTYFDHNRLQWASIYPFGWPALLAIGELVHLPWIIAPICGMVSLAILQRLAQQLYGHEVALIATTIALVSPLTILLSASMLSHAATTLVLLLSLFWLEQGLRSLRPNRLFFSGAALGYAFGIRPLTAVIFAACIGVYVLVGKRREIGWPPLSRSFAFLVAGGLIGATPTFWANFAVTGHPLQFAYSVGSDVHWSVSNMFDHLEISDSALALVAPTAFPWLSIGLPPTIALALTYGLILVPFVIGRTQKPDWLFAAIFIGTCVLYAGHNASGSHGYGPRFYSEAYPALFLLASRGIVELIRLPYHFLSHRESTRDIRTEPTEFPMHHAPLIVILLIVVCSMNLPLRIQQTSGYNHVSSELYDEVQRQQISYGVIILADPDVFSWIRASRMIPGDYATADLVVLAGHGDNHQILKAFPNRPYFIWSHKKLLKYDK